MAEVEESGRPGALGSALRLRFASLPTRIIVAVFSAAIVTGLAVTGISTSSTESFLRSKIDARFPELLHSAAGRLEQWYAQREIDVATFASSETLVASLRGRAGSADEARRYLAYVREGFPLYRTLFVLDPQGRVQISVGDTLGLLPEQRETLARIERGEVSNLIRTPSARLQIVSAPIERDGRRIGTLHAAIEVEALGTLLAENDVDEGTDLYVVAGNAAVLASNSGGVSGAPFERPLPTPGAPARVEDYYVSSGEHRVGGALSLGRFGWTLVLEQGYDVAFAPVVSATGKVLSINLGIVAAFGLLALLIARSITQPIRALSDTARRIAQGETDVEIPQVEGQDEIGVLSRALAEMVDRLRKNQADLTRLNEDLHRNNEVLEQLSFTDGLTQLHNHRFFQDRLRIEAKRSDRADEPLALLLIDIDDFKKLNDEHGHASGDEVLRRVAAILNEGVRDTDLPTRYGGEEFAVLAPRTDEAGAISLAEKLREAVSRARFRDVEDSASEELAVTVSVGVSLYGGDVKRFFSEADRALYQAKGAGKDCVILFGEALDA